MPRSSWPISACESATSRLRAVAIKRASMAAAGLNCVLPRAIA
jgi:hypothetical protein